MFIAVRSYTNYYVTLRFNLFYNKTADLFCFSYRYDEDDADTRTN